MYVYNSTTVFCLKLVGITVWITQDPSMLLHMAAWSLPFPHRCWHDWSRQEGSLRPNISTFSLWLRTSLLSAHRLVPSSGHIWMEVCWQTLVCLDSFAPRETAKGRRNNLSQQHFYPRRVFFLLFVGNVWRHPRWEPAYRCLWTYRWLSWVLLEGHASARNGASQRTGGPAGREHPPD